MYFMSIGTTTEQECDQLKIMFKIGVIEWKNVSCSKRVFASRSVTLNPSPDDV